MRVRSPVLLVVLALLVRRRGVDGTTLLRWTLGAAAVRALAPAVLVPVALVGSLVGVLGVVLVLAGGITVATRAAGLG